MKDLLVKDLLAKGFEEVEIEAGVIQYHYFTDDMDRVKYIFGYEPLSDGLCLAIDQDLSKAHILGECPLDCEADIMPIEFMKYIERI